MKASLRRSLLTLTVLGSGLASAGDWGPIKDSPGSPVLVEQPDGGSAPANPLPPMEDGGVGIRLRPGKPPLDVSKMPFTQAAVKDVVSYHQEEIQSCYEETMAQHAKALEGKVLTSFVIGPDGHVKGAKVERKGTTLKD